MTLVDDWLDPLKTPSVPKDGAPGRTTRATSALNVDQAFVPVAGSCRSSGTLGGRARPELS